MNTTWTIKLITNAGDFIELKCPKGTNRALAELLADRVRNDLMPYVSNLARVETDGH